MHGVPLLFMNALKLRLNRGRKSLSDVVVKWRRSTVPWMMLDLFVYLAVKLDFSGKSPKFSKFQANIPNSRLQSIFGTHNNWSPSLLIIHHRFLGASPNFMHRELQFCVCNPRFFGNIR